MEEFEQLPPAGMMQKNGPQIPNSQHRAKGDIGVTDTKRNIGLADYAVWLFLGIIALVPLPFGSTDPAASTIWCVLLSASMMLSLRRSIREEVLGLLVAGLGVGLTFSLIVSGQTWFLPWSERAPEVWTKASSILGTHLLSHPTITAKSPFLAAGPGFSNLLAYITGILIGQSRHHARWLLLTVAWSGFGYALYGIFGALFEPEMILWRERDGYFGSVIGTFNYRNTAAVYFGACAAVWQLLLCEAIRNLMPDGRLRWKFFKKNVLGKARFGTISRFCGFFVCLSATAMSGSRAGIIISILCMTAAGLVYFRSDVPRSIGLRGKLAGLALLTIVILQIINGSLNQRFETSGFSDENRFDVYRATMRMIAEHPWVGAGLGTFPDMFPVYREIPPSMWGRWEIAHSTPLELAAEMGVPFDVLAVALLGTGLVFMAMRIYRRGRILIPLTAVTVMSIALIHSCIDFSLQIPGFSIVVFALFGIGLAQTAIVPEPYVRGEQKPPVEPTAKDGAPQPVRSQEP